jgi:cell wall-associated NlpC family hydrolase
MGIDARLGQIRSLIASVSVAPAAPAVRQAPATSTASDFARTLAQASQPVPTTGASSTPALSASVRSADTGTAGPAWPAAGPPDGADVVAGAKKYLGVPYRWGGTDPTTGLDCSGLVQKVLGDLGVRVPRTVADQKDFGAPVASMGEARPGDLLAFGSHHIGIYLGGGRMLHAPKTGDVVRITDVYDRPTRIRRVLPAEGTTSVLQPSSVDLAGVRPASLRSTQGGSSPYDGLLASANERYGLPPGLLRAVAKAESGFDAGARSPAGAIGLMQIMPGTARELGVDPTDPVQAVDGAARLLRDHLRTFGSVELALAAYNAGPGAVRRHGGVPPYAETQSYVAKVTRTMAQVAA